MNLKEKQKAESRIKILKAASALFKEKGYQATGVDELMKKADLTAGAFYAHFKSKKQLLDETIKFSLQSNRKLLLSGTEGLEGEDFIQAVLSKYVSSLHRDRPEIGCVLPAFGSEIPRNSKQGQQMISNYLEEWVEMILPHLEGDPKAKRAEAVRLFAQAIGGILLSRAVLPEISDEVLQATKNPGSLLGS